MDLPAKHLSRGNFVHRSEGSKFLLIFWGYEQGILGK